MKGGIFTIHKRILSEHNQLDNQITEIKKQLNSLPDGKLICTRNQNRYKWYQSDGHAKTYIPKENRNLAEDLAIKKYLSLLLEDLEAEKRAIQFYLNHHAPSGKAEQLLTQPSEYRNLLAPYFKPLSQELSDWMNSPYEHNTLHPEHLTRTCPSGNIVRSKSEAIIDTLLYVHQIPFRYECALQIGKTTLFPDFTIRHPQTGESFYWEHFGLMDNPEYIRSACSKLQFYSTHGIIPSIHLVTTYETKEHPLSTEAVEKLIQHYFL